MNKIITIVILSLIAAHLSLLLALAQNHPFDVTLTWSANTYLPPGYLGKALPIKHSSVEVVANINKPTPPVAELDFRWFLDDKVKKYASGLGQAVFRFVVTKPSGSEHEIRLEIRTADGTLLLTKYLFIRIASPQIVIYQTNPHLQALTHQAQIKSNQELKLAAQPYFFNIAHPKELDYDWNFAGQKAIQISPENPNLLSLKIGQVNQEITEKLKLKVVNEFNPRERDSLDLELIIQP